MYFSPIQFKRCKSKKRMLEMGIRIKGRAFLLGFLLSINFCLAQTPDVFRLEYMLMPRNTAEAKLSRIKLVANMPIKVGKNDNIIVELLMTM